MGRGAAPDPSGAGLFPACDEERSAGVETIYEGYLVHHGGPASSRLDAGSLLGDYLYAQGSSASPKAGERRGRGDLAI